MLLTGASLNVSASFLAFISLGIFTSTLFSILLIRRFWISSLGRDEADGIRKIQTYPVLRIGGLALAGTFAACLFATSLLPQFDTNSTLALAFILLGFALFLIGFIDDLFGLPALLKFAGQLAVGTGAYLAGMRIDMIANPFGDGSIELGIFGFVITLIWFVSIPNLINIIDGMDGLAGGLGLFLSLTLGALGILSGDPFLATMGLGYASGLSAFLIFNFPPAKIYMGDGGAYLTGYFIAATSLVTSNTGSVTGPLLVVLLGLGFPILDATLTIMRRSLTGMPILKADARHLHHHLMTLGFSKRTIVLFLYGLFASLALAGITIFLTKGYALPIVIALLVTGIYIGLKSIGFPHSLSEAKLLFEDMLTARKEVRYAYALAQVLQHDFDRIPDADTYWNQLLESLGKLGIQASTPQNGEPANDSSTHCSIQFPINKTQIWHLKCPAEKLKPNQWARVIRCFHLPMLKGLDKWGEPPHQLGLQTSYSLETANASMEA